MDKDKTLVISSFLNTWTLLQTHVVPLELSLSCCRLLLYIKHCIDKKYEFGVDLCLNYITLAFYVRDISHGLGKRLYFYLMIRELYDIFPLYCASIFPLLLESKYGYGSWRDIVGLCQCLRIYYGETDNNLIQISLRFLIEQLRKEHCHFSKHKKCITHAVKWIPKESSSKKWIYNKLVSFWYNIPEVEVCSGHKRGFRKMISRMNKSLPIIERNLAENDRKHIDFSKVSNASLLTHWNSLANQTPDYQYKSFSKNKNDCMLDFSNHFSKTKKEVPRSIITNIPYSFPNTLGKLVKRGLTFLNQREINPEDLQSFSYAEERHRLNAMWDKLKFQWIAKYKSHSYFPVLRLHDPLFHRFSCQSIGIALLLFETKDIPDLGIYYDTQHPDQADWILLPENGAFIEYLEIIYNQVSISLVPDCPSHFVCSEELPVFISNGNCSMGDKNKFIGQDEDVAFDSVFEKITQILRHPRFQYVKDITSQLFN